VLVNSLSQALMAEIALDCGYPPNSPKERVYALPGLTPGGSEDRCGILLYRATAGAQGTRNRAAVLHGSCKAPLTARPSVPTIRCVPTTSWTSAAAWCPKSWRLNRRLRLDLRSEIMIRLLKNVVRFASTRRQIRPPRQHFQPFQSPHRKVFSPGRVRISAINVRAEAEFARLHLACRPSRGGGLWRRPPFGSRWELTTGEASYLVTGINSLACSQSGHRTAEPAGQGCATCEVKHYQPTFGNR
jgi:hypothetical protein